MLNFQSFRAADSVLTRIKRIQIIRKIQFTINYGDAMSFADQLSALTGMAHQFERHSAVQGNFAV